MKKTLTLAFLFMALTVALVGCGKKDAANDSAAPVAGVNAESNDKSNGNDASSGIDMGQSIEADHIVFSVRGDYKLKQDAWLGIIPAGTKYTEERDADDVDIYYTYCDNMDDENRKDFRFKYDKNFVKDIEDGTYNMVLCDTDDGEVGKVLFQIKIDKKGDSIKLYLDK